MNSYISFENEAYARQIGYMSERFNALLGFVRAGLRGVARAGVMPRLEVLAEVLEGPGRGGGARGDLTLEPGLVVGGRKVKFWV